MSNVVVKAEADRIERLIEHRIYPLVLRERNGQSNHVDTLITYCPGRRLAKETCRYVNRTLTDEREDAVEKHDTLAGYAHLRDAVMSVGGFLADLCAAWDMKTAFTYVFEPDDFVFDTERTGSDGLCRPFSDGEMAVMKWTDRKSFVFLRELQQEPF